ncbi:conserved membrane hypothetical protein [uncultured Desulfatiglans sp.]|nr:conserved membrane hypothetical protein [uncultured Desulfatiglans sp.]
MHTFLWLLGLTYTLLRGDLAERFDVLFSHLDILTVLTVYAFHAFGAVSAGVFALAQGLCMDLFSHGKAGLFPLLYLTTVAAVAVLRRLFELGNPKGQVIICTAAEICIHTVRAFLFILLFPALSPSFQSFLNSALISATMTGLSGPIIFLLLDRLSAVLTKSAASGPNGKIG